jgi:hypothetical protein
MKKLHGSRPEGSRPLLPPLPEAGSTLLSYWFLGGNHIEILTPVWLEVKEASGEQA